MIEQVNRKYFRMAVDKLKKDTPNDMSACCPLCGDTKNRLHLYHTPVSDLVHCFNSSCELEEKHHSMKNFLDIINSSHLHAYKRETMQNTVASLRNESSLQDILDKANAKNAPEAAEHNEPEIPLDTLFEKAKDSPEAVEYLKNRNIEVQDRWYFSKSKYFVHNDQRVFLENYLIIPIINESGKYRGFYSRSIGPDKKFSMFLLDGTEKVWIQNPIKKPTHFCEGIFDALSGEFDNPAAMLGAGLNKDYMNTLDKETVFIFDNDVTGIKKAIEYCDLGFKIFVWPEINFKDLNEMLCKGFDKSQITEMVNENIFSGIMAKTRLKMKEV